MTYDQYLDNIPKIKNNNIIYSSLVSLLPLFPLSIKLMTRKNRGKKPYSLEFKYEEKVEQIKEINSLVRESLDNQKYKTTLIDSLKLFIQILAEAKNEIKNIGLQNDFVYMINETKIIVDLLSN